MMSNVSNALGTWIPLSHAAQFAARLGGVDERIAALMDAGTWGLEARRKIDYGDWPKEVEADIQKAREVLKALSDILDTGRVAGSQAGAGAAQPFAPISELEWASCYVHFWKNELQSIRTNQLRIVDVWVRTEDVRRELERELAARRSAKPRVDLSAVIRGAARANGGYITQKNAFKIARAAGATDCRKKNSGGADRGDRPPNIGTERPDKESRRHDGVIRRNCVNCTDRTELINPEPSLTNAVPDELPTDYRTTRPSPEGSRKGLRRFADADLRMAQNRTACQRAGRRRAPDRG
jgi:hypothetical protein